MFKVKGCHANANDTRVKTIPRLFVAFAENHATMSLIRYFENRALYFVQKRRKYTPLNSIFIRTMSVSISLKYIVNNGILKYSG